MKHIGEVDGKENILIFTFARLIELLFMLASVIISIDQHLKLKT